MVALFSGSGGSSKVISRGKPHAAPKAHAKPAPRLPAGRLGTAVQGKGRAKPKPAKPKPVVHKAVLTSFTGVKPAKPGSKAWWSDPGVLGLPPGTPASAFMPGGKSVKPGGPALIAGQAAPQTGAARAVIPHALPPVAVPPQNTQQAVYSALRSKGLTATQAAGIMGNIQNESSFNVAPGGPAGVPDSGGTRSYGLIQWNSGGLGAGGVGQSMVSGTLAQDFTKQINAIAAIAKRINLTSSSPSAAATQWASQVEGCVGCQPGGSQSVQRAANAEAFAQQISSQNWAKYVGGIVQNIINPGVGSLPTRVGIPVVSPSPVVSGVHPPSSVPAGTGIAGGGGKPKAVKGPKVKAATPTSAGFTPGVNTSGFSTKGIAGSGTGTTTNSSGGTTTNITVPPDFIYSSGQTGGITYGSNLAAPAATGTTGTSTSWGTWLLLGGGALVVVLLLTGKKSTSTAGKALPGK